MSIQRIVSEMNPKWSKRFSVISDPKVETYRLTCDMFLLVIPQNKVVRFINFSHYEPSKRVTRQIEQIVYPLTAQGYTLE